MNLIDVKFEKLKAQGEGALICYFPLGEIGFDTLDLARTYVENGVDILEIGFPVRNPYLDGNVIANSMARILKKGFDAYWYFTEVQKIRNEFRDQPIELFCYRQIFDQMEENDFVALCEESKIDAILIADADRMELTTLDDLLPAAIYNLRFVPYNYTGDHIRDAAVSARGYIFLQATEGATGARDEVDAGLEGKIHDLKRKIGNIPICPGFGISSPAHCRQIKRMKGDGVIVGSRLVSNLITHPLRETGELIRKLKFSLT